MARLDTRSMRRGLFETVLVILLGRVEQMVRTPCFVGEPKQCQEQDRERPVEPPGKDRQQQAGKAREPLFATIVR